MDRRLNRLHVWILTAAIALVGLSRQSLAQIVDIPDSIRQNTGSLSEQDKATVKAFVDANSKNLLEADPAKAEDLRRDRNQILSKLQGQNISVSFRLAYSAALQDVVGKMLASGNEKIVINGLVIAGELATDQSLLMVQGKLNDKAPAVRYEAACSLKRVFRAVQVNQPALNNLAQAVRLIEPQAAQEANPYVLQALLRAGIEAASIPAERPAAISAISKGLAAWARNNKNPLAGAELDACLVGAVGLRDVMTQAQQQGIAIPANAATDAAECSGVLLGAVANVVEKAEKPEAVADRPKLVQLASSAANTIDLTSQLMGSQPVVRMNPQETLGKATKAGDAEFVLNVKGVLGEKLARAPWNIDPARFNK
ncbi:MAG TPA: hypothetical protein VD997_10485 [Phycisphaerales bacterium]|nr:hypothetical protein [Phycisphaerales bacterium]